MKQKHTIKNTKVLSSQHIEFKDERSSVHKPSEVIQKMALKSKATLQNKAINKHYKVNATSKWIVLNMSHKGYTCPHNHVNSTTKWYVQNMTGISKQKYENPLQQVDSRYSQSQTLLPPKHISDQQLGNDAEHLPVTFCESSDTIKELSEEQQDSYSEYESESEKAERCENYNRNNRDHEGKHTFHDMCNDINISYDEEVETADGIKGNAGKERNSSQKEVPVQHWDHYVKDLSKQLHKETSAPSGKPKWDGTRKTNSGQVVETLLKEKSTGFGKWVLSWEGNQSTVDEESERGQKQNDRQWWLAQYEEELDHGKVKKMKKKCRDDMYGTGTNVFQFYQNYKNVQKDTSNHQLRICQR